MTLAVFKSTLNEEQAPAGITSSLAALWYDAKGDWEQAHAIAQDLPTTEGAWVHAYLHRKEGDDWNASYWYNRAGRSMPDCTLDKEWEDIAKAFLGQGK